VLERIAGVEVVLLVEVLPVFVRVDRVAVDDEAELLALERLDLATIAPNSTETVDVRVDEVELLVGLYIAAAEIYQLGVAESGDRREGIEVGYPVELRVRHSDNLRRIAGRASIPFDETEIGVQVGVAIEPALLVLDVYGEKMVAPEKGVDLALKPRRQVATAYIVG
jgi:hypothetical protein